MKKTNRTTLFASLLVGAFALMAASEAQAWYSCRTYPRYYPTRYVRVYSHRPVYRRSLSYYRPQPYRTYYRRPVYAGYYGYPYSYYRGCW